MALFNRHVAFILLGIWLVVYGAIALLSLTFNGIDTFMGVTAILIGLMLIFTR